VITGVFRDGHPRLTLFVNGTPTDLVLDTGFEGEIALPGALAQRLCGPTIGSQAHRMADGRLVHVPVHQVELDWQGELSSLVVLRLEGEPLAGTELLYDRHLPIESPRTCYWLEGGW
jgi:predicted aspartyl protease